MIRIVDIVRMVMILLCLVPFSNVRQMSGALAVYIPTMPAAPMNESPAPVSEEDDERETAGVKERLVSQARHRSAFHMTLLPLYGHSLPSLASTVHRSTPFDADPFRNGLGTPYRC